MATNKKAVLAGTASQIFDHSKFSSNCADYALFYTCEQGIARYFNDQGRPTDPRKKVDHASFERIEEHFNCGNYHGIALIKDGKVFEHLPRGKPADLTPTETPSICVPSALPGEAKTWGHGAEIDIPHTPIETEVVSGYGQFHTNETDPQNPGKKLTPYVGVTIEQIRAMVDSPQGVGKAQAQWLIPSTLKSRNFKEQERSGEFWMLWADLDQDPKPFDEVERILCFGILVECNFELYTSRSATQERPKGRILIPLDRPLQGHEWMLCQEVLNDKLLANDITPDRASERPGQLCYLPNRGEYYEVRHRRQCHCFDPLTEWSAELAEKRNTIKRKASELEVSKKAAAERREVLKLSDSPNTIDAFNLAYSVQEVLSRAGYEQRGDTFRHPRSESGSYSANINDGRVHSLSSSDPLYTGGVGGGAHDAFSAFVVLFAGGDTSEALKLAGDQWLMIGDESWNKVQRREYAIQQAQQSNINLFSNVASAQDDPDKPSRFRLLNPNELAELPPIRWRVRGVLPQEGISAIYGPSGSGKSFLAIDMLAAIAAGSEWFGYRCNAAPVVYVGLEGQAGIAQRIKAWVKQNGDLPENFRAILTCLDIRKADDRAELVKTLQSAGMLGGLLVLDTLAQSAPGMEENSSEDMGLVVAASKALQAALGGLIMVIHHSGKDVTRGMRGHSSLIAALDASIEVSRDGDSRQWKVAKAKDGEDGKEHPFKLEVIELGLDDDFESITSCIVARDELMQEVVRRAKLPRGGNQKIIWVALGELFREAGAFPPAHAPESLPPGRPCLLLEDAIAKTRDRLTVQADRKTERTRHAITGLINRGLLECREGWIWCS